MHPNGYMAYKSKVRQSLLPKPNKHTLAIEKSIQNFNRTRQTSRGTLGCVNTEEDGNGNGSLGELSPQAKAQKAALEAQKVVKDFDKEIKVIQSVIAGADTGKTGPNEGELNDELGSTF